MTWWFIVEAIIVSFISIQIGKSIERDNKELPYVWKCPDPSCTLEVSSNNKRIMSAVKLTHSATHT